MISSYTETANTLVERVVTLIGNHPEILDLEDCWGLLQYPDFAYRDLEPTLYQMSWALRKAKFQYLAEAAQ